MDKTNRTILYYVCCASVGNSLFASVPPESTITDALGAPLSSEKQAQRKEEKCKKMAQIFKPFLGAMHKEEVRRRAEQRLYLRATSMENDAHEESTNPARGTTNQEKRIRDSVIEAMVCLDLDLELEDMVSGLRKLAKNWDVPYEEVCELAIHLAKSRLKYQRKTAVLEKTQSQQAQREEEIREKTQRLIKQRDNPDD
jgi:hypothetical protein